jgi:CheY-like chemotaxis protein/GGDEF domain-containing protein
MPKGRILAVDDQRYFRELLEGLLAEEGYEVVTAASGEEAVRILEQSRFDIILTDLVMPGMDGSDLVHRVKQRDPEQDIVVVTGVVDVKTAVDAMKLGASEYLIKPFDRVTLAAALDKILQNRRLKAEHARLLAENIEYMGERSLFERAAALFTCLAVDPLAARIVEGLCIETRAQGGSVWVVDEAHPECLQLTAVRGLVRVNEEPDVLSMFDVPDELRDGSRASALLPWSEEGGEERPALYFAMRRDGLIIGLVRLTDKLGHDEFDSVDQACGEKFVEFGGTALANALRFAGLEQRSLVDPGTGAYIFEYFHDVVRSEIEKSNRFGRSFSVLRVELGSLAPLRSRLSEADYHDWLAAIVTLFQGAIRSADLLAADGEGRFLVLLPETDALGGAVSKQRIEQAAAAGDPIASLAQDERPQINVAGVSYPGDGTQLESLLRVLTERIEADRRSCVRALGLAKMTLAESLAALIDEGEDERPEVADSIVRFLIAEVARRPDDRGLLFVGPGAGLRAAAAEALETLAELSSRTQVIVVSECSPPPRVGTGVAWLSPPAGEPLPPFLVRYSEGAVYALIRSEKAGDEGVRLYHSNDRSVVEFLTFGLQRELGLPELA